MSAMDVPRRQRPLAGVDQALGEGSARQPTELLDQLRERLARLDSNHPSASRRPADQADPGVETSAVEEVKAGSEVKADSEVKAGNEAQTGDKADSATATADRPEARRNADQTGGDDRTGGDGAGDPADPGPSAAEPTRAWSDGGSPDAHLPGNGPLDAGQDRLKRAGSADPYRPWFATDESVTPWFAE
jgi:hypothetical protein